MSVAVASLASTCTVPPLAVASKADASSAPLLLTLPASATSMILPSRLTKLLASMMPVLLTTVAARSPAPLAPR